MALMMHIGGYAAHLYRAFQNVLRDCKHLQQENKRTYFHSHKKTEKVLSRNNQQMSRHTTLFPVNSLHVSDTFHVKHQEINKINLAESGLSQDDGRPHDPVNGPEVA
jgi:hypothetical protein